MRSAETVLGIIRLRRDTGEPGAPKGARPVRGGADGKGLTEQLASRLLHLFGGDIAAIRKIAFERFDLQFIESPLIIFMFQFGLFGTVAFLAVLAIVFRRLLAGAAWPVVLGAVTFLGVALGNNTLSSKTSSILLVFMLIEASR